MADELLGYTVTRQRSNREARTVEVVVAMAQLIEFYVPEKFRRQRGHWISPEEHGEIIPFPHRNRSLHDIKTLLVAYASGTSGWQTHTGLSSPQHGNSHLDW